MITTFIDAEIDSHSHISLPPAQKVPEWNQTVQCDPLEDFVDTASISGRAVEPGKLQQLPVILDYFI